MDFHEARDVVRNIKYKDWKIQVHADHFGHGMYLQIHIVSRDGEMGCRKWRLSEHMTRSEIVGTAFMAVKAAEEHECREAFQYFGVAVYGPHLNADDLVEIIGAGRVRLDSRS